MRSVIGLIAVLFLASIALPASADTPNLSGGRAAMADQNRACDADDLTRLQDFSDLKQFVEQGHLVEISDTDAYYLDDLGSHDSKHAAYYHYARPWTERFMKDELGALNRAYGVRAKITSLVRTQVYQDRICKAGNRAATCGSEWWEISAHLTGAAVDVSKKGMSRKAQSWFRKRLRTLEREGKVDAIEERGAFHVLVRRKYSPPKERRKHPKHVKSKVRKKRKHQH